METPPALRTVNLSTLIMERQVLIAQNQDLAARNTALEAEVLQLRSALEQAGRQRQQGSAVSQGKSRAKAKAPAEAEEEEEEDYDSEEEYEQEPKKGRGKADRNTTSAGKPTAAQKEEAKAVRQRGMQFLRSAGSYLSNGMAWQLRGRTVNFATAVDPAAFNYVFGSQGQQFDAPSANGKKKLRMIKLDYDATVAVFGKTRFIKKYRLGNVGSVKSTDVTYDSILQKATCAVQWEVE